MADVNMLTETQYENELHANLSISLSFSDNLLHIPCLNIFFKTFFTFVSYSSLSIYLDLFLSIKTFCTFPFHPSN